jgi:F-type H+-transporting ATPase subunit b
MEETLRQLGQLLLSAIPTMVLLLTLYGLYTFLLHKPLEAVLAERRTRTQGAVEKAKADIALASQRATEYEDRLREARLAVFKALDNRRKQALEARVAAVAAARERATQQVSAAKAQLELDTVSARATLGASSETIASQIIQAVLKSAGSAPATVGGR